MEYHDAFGIVALILPSIVNRLPLRDLDWQTATRPLRRIKSLHLDFVPDEFTRSSSLAPDAGSEVPTSSDILRSGVNPKKSSRERRHQIPGLQTSPFLKVYISRCDNKDTYKSVERERIREWLRGCGSRVSTTKTTKAKKENHDAFEWMILHVVVPDTHAASEPRWRESQREPDELRERKHAPKWPGKSTRTVFDKLRADFNDSSKAAGDRVAQIRLAKDQVPNDLLPTPAQGTTYEETADEREKSWNDLTTKLKHLILESFDRRVRQYEADIAEQEARRSLPGFNFCTFFIHKEGLAKALEGIGLVEDALVLYDELSLGLENVLRAIANGTAEGTATSFPSYTEGIPERIVGSRCTLSNGHNADGDQRPEHGDDAGAVEKSYREKIVHSNISVFEFLGYIFARQKALILRIAKANAAYAHSSPGQTAGVEDLVLVSEVCWRAMSFMHNSARVLRQDLLANRAHSATQLSDADIEALVCSWIHSTAGQILDDTASSTLEQPTKINHRDNAKSILNGDSGARRSAFRNLGGANNCPQRTTSLPARNSRVGELMRDRDSFHSQSEEILAGRHSDSMVSETQSRDRLPGLPELMTYRAELVMMRRKMLGQCAKQRRWLAGWATIETGSPQMDKIEIPGHYNTELSAPENEPSTMLHPSLEMSLATSTAFHAAFTSLTELALRYYVSATQVNSAEVLMGDLAILKLQARDYEYAVQFFQHVLPLYRSEGWDLMAAQGNKMLANALKELNRWDEVVAILLDLFAKLAEGKREGAGRLAEHTSYTQGLLRELLLASEETGEEVKTAAAQYFSDIRLQRNVIHREKSDGFALRFHLRHLLNEDLPLDAVTARLTHADDRTQEILLSSATPITLKIGQQDLLLQTDTVAFGPYFFEQVVLRAKNIHFVYDFNPAPATEMDSLDIFSNAEHPFSDAQTQIRPWAFVYPCQWALGAELALAGTVFLGEASRLEVRLNSGQNDITALSLKLRPASAGLRLHTADLDVEGIRIAPEAISTTGEMEFEGMKQHAAAVLSVPYTLETPAASIVVHLVARYRTAAGLFTFMTSATLSTVLPLDVEVHEIFHFDKLFSTFAVRPTASSPLTVASASLGESALYDAQPPPVLTFPMHAFGSEPVRLIYELSRKAQTGKMLKKKDAALALHLEYSVLEECCVDAVCTRFAEALDQANATLGSLNRLLKPLMRLRASQLISVHDLQTAALIDKARIPAFDDIGWLDVLRTLPQVVQRQTEAWLREWHKANPAMPLPVGGVPKHIQRSITIPVDVPSVDFVHKVSLTLPDVELPARSPKTHAMVTLGRPLAARLTITTTELWDTKSRIQSARRASSRKKDGYFVYDIQADDDAWLVGGSQRSHFRPSPEVIAVDVLLIPLRLGTLSLPRVDIQPAPSSEPATSDASMTCETQYTSAAHLVQVVNDLRTTRVHIPESTNNATTKAHVSHSSRSAAVTTPSAPKDATSN